jgi:hypothetical protein
MRCLIIRVESVRDEKQKSGQFSGKFGSEEDIIDTTKKGTKVIFTLTKPFLKLQIPHGICSKDDQNYCYLNNGLTIILMAKNTILKTDLKIY